LDGTITDQRADQEAVSTGVTHHDIDTAELGYDSTGNVCRLSGAR
jgi:hypothetical protein